MELDITFLTDTEEVDLMDFAASCAEIGENAARETWQNSIESGFVFVSTPKEREEARDYIRSTGGWTREEINEWNNEELNGLILQFIAGDLREFLRAEKLSTAEFKKWEENQGGRIYRSKGKVYFYLGN